MLRPWQFNLLVNYVCHTDDSHGGGGESNALIWWDKKQTGNMHALDINLVSITLSHAITNLAIVFSILH